MQLLPNRAASSWQNYGISICPFILRLSMTSFFAFPFPWSLLANPPPAWEDIPLRPLDS
jgi:hypothetical protein